MIRRQDGQEPALSGPIKADLGSPPSTHFMAAGGAMRRGRGRPRKVAARRAVTAQDIKIALGPRLAEAVAASWQGCSLRDMRAPTRSVARIAAARQFGMYLTHTLFHLSMTRTGAVFGRDRTTVRHACQHVEDWRERPRREAPLLVLEVALARWAEHFACELAGGDI